MVIVSFVTEGQEILRLSVAYGERAKLLGDGSWLDFDFSVPSPRLGHPITYSEDAEEWARSLPEAYAGSAMQAQVVEDTAMEAVLVAAASGARVRAPALQHGTITHNLQISAWRQPRLLALAGLLVIILVAVVLLHL